MKVYISVDMEGIGGIVEERQVSAENFDTSLRREARELLTSIYAWFTEGFDTADLKSAKSLLDEFAAPNQGALENEG